jgi:hypothetical protein
MRYRELIWESPKAYLPMFNGVPVEPRALLDHIQKVETALKRQDRITWFLKWSRIYFMHLAEQKGQQIDEKLKRKALSAINPTITWERAVSDANHCMNDFDIMKHLLGLPVPAIQNYVWNTGTSVELLTQLEWFEEQFKEEVARKGGSVRIQEGDKKILEFPDGWAWWLLDRGACKDEANAMGHCGNVPSERPGDQIVSLRRHLYGDLWEPHLTFILDRNGELGEMKGKGNDKPAARYHPYVVALLKSDYVDGIKGGGYAPENNFSIDDLEDEDEKETLLNDKPGLKGLDDVYRAWNREQDPEKKEALKGPLIERVKKRLESLNLDYYDIDKEDMAIVISSDSIDDYCRYHDDRIASKIYTFLEEDGQLETELQDAYNASITDAREITNAVSAQYQLPLFRDTIDLGVEFSLYNVYMKVDEATNPNEYSTVKTLLSISDFCRDDEEHDVTQVQELDEARNDNYYWEDVKYHLDHIKTDDLGMLLIEYCGITDRDQRFSKITKPSLKRLLQTILHRFDPKDRGGTIYDPNQRDLFNQPENV